MQKFYADAAGNFLGSHDGPGAGPHFEAGEIEVPIAPAHGLQRWDGVAWVDTAALISAVAKDELAASDAGMARVVEEIYDALIAKGVIAAADLPKASRDRIAARKLDRAKL